MIEIINDYNKFRIYFFSIFTIILNSPLVWNIDKEAKKKWKREKETKIDIDKMGNRRSKTRYNKLSEKEIQMLLHKTVFSREEILEWHKTFLVSLYWSIKRIRLTLSLRFLLLPILKINSSKIYIISKIWS